MALEEVTIGNARLILGDCREVLPLLPRVDAVMFDKKDAVMLNGRHEESAEGKHSPPSECGGDLGATSRRDSRSIRERGVISEADGGALRRDAIRVPDGLATAWDSGEVARQGGGSERTLQGREAEHGLSGDGPEGTLQQVRRDALAGGPSQGRDTYEQCAGQSGSALLAVPQPAPQARMVEFPEGWEILTDRRHFDTACERIRQAHAQTRLAI